MPLSALIGNRLRDQRLLLGIRQGDLAEKAGISASYLNLIEHNRRRISDDLLARLAQALGLRADALKGPGAGVIIDDLRASAAEYANAEARIASQSPEIARPEIERAEEFAARFPGWAATLVSTHRRAAGLSRSLEALNDRMSHDPHLSASLHEMLSAVASVRSTAAILAETEDLEPEWRDRFLRNLRQDSERLAAGAEALVAYLDATGPQDAEQSIATPQEEVEAWAQDSDWVMDKDPERLSSLAARAMARAWQARAEADRASLPDAAFAAALARSDDPLVLAAEFSVPVLTVFRRLALRSGSGMGLVLCDGSGTLTFRKPHAGFPLPRFGAACPLWPLFAALGRPMTPIEARIQTIGPEGRRFFIRAFCQPVYPHGSQGPELREAAMLIQPAPAGPVQEYIGPTCRICQRQDCPARREVSILTL